jgi:1-acyl-sn-glycerol-3-phosphate acyltransferase
MNQRHAALIKKQAKLEAAGELNTLITPPNAAKIKKFDETHKYIQKSIFSRVNSLFWRGLFMIICVFINFFYFRLKIKGRKNLKGINASIVTCNHVENMDNVMVRQAVRGHRLYITVGHYNNRNDLIGKFMRVAGTLPIPNPDEPNIRAYANFNKAIEYCLFKKSYILFYPEVALWWRYEKPRPFKEGAFYFAAKHNVPIVPLFITWRRNKSRAVIHILKPVYPCKELSRKDNIEYLKNTAQKECAEKYKEFYQKDCQK